MTQDTPPASTEDATTGRRGPAALRLLGTPALSRLRCRSAGLSWRALRNPHFDLAADDSESATRGD